MRRNRLFAVAVASSVLAGSVIGGAAVAQDPMTLEIKTFGGMGLDELVAQYETDHPGIKINFTTADHAAHHDALLTGIATGQVPDIAAIEVGFMSKFKAQPENFKNLLDYGAADLEADYLPWRWERPSPRTAARSSASPRMWVAWPPATAPTCSRPPACRPIRPR